MVSSTRHSRLTVKGKHVFGQYAQSSNRSFGDIYFTNPGKDAIFGKVVNLKNWRLDIPLKALSLNLCQFNFCVEYMPITLLLI